jgi:LysR family nod box-dependent transcriptional activator
MDSRNFDLNLLRTLQALLETRSVSSAARRLHRSQPAVSAALSRLRDAIGDTLLVREGNRMVLSPRAERMLPRLRQLMTDLGQILEDYEFDPKRSERAFRIAATDDALEIIVGPTIERLRAAAPNAQFDLVSISEDVDRDLAAGRVDVVVGAYWWLRRLRHRVDLFTDHWVGISSSRNHYSLSEYTDAEHVLVAPHGRKPGVVDVELQRRRLVRRVTVTVPDFASAARLIASSSMIATIPGRIAAHYADHYPLRAFEPPLSLPILRMGLGTNARAFADPATSWLIEQIKMGATT